jgi:hypothetical protein
VLKTAYRQWREQLEASRRRSETVIDQRLTAAPPGVRDLYGQVKVSEMDFNYFYEVCYNLVKKIILFKLKKTVNKI